MKVSDVMTTAVATVEADATIETIAALMVDRRISGVPVVNGERQVLGMISEGDLIRRQELGTEARAKGWLSLLTSPEKQARDFIRSHGLRAQDVMSSPVHSTRPDAPIADLARQMERQRIKRLPVIDGGKLVGLVSRADLLRLLASIQAMTPPPPPASDRSIRQHLLKTIENEAWAASAMVNVIVSEGVVHLWGVVDTDEQRQALLVAAREIGGVKGVEDHLGVDIPT